MQKKNLKSFSITSVLIASHTLIVLLAVIFLMIIGINITSKNTQELLHDKGDLFNSLLIKQIGNYLDEVEKDAELVASLIINKNETNLLTLEQSMEIFLLGNHQISDIKLVKKTEPPNRKEKGKWMNPYIDSGTVHWQYTKDIFKEDLYLTTLILSINMKSLKETLDSSIVHHDQKNFILYGPNHVLISPKDSSYYLNSKKRLSLRTVNQSKDHKLSSIWSKNSKTLIPPDAKHHIKESHKINIIDETTVFLYAVLDKYGSTPLFVGCYFPFSTIDQQIKRIDVYIFIGGIILIISLFFAVLIGRIYSLPIKILSKSAHAISKLEFRNINKLPRSRVKEIDDASVAFNEMSNGLKATEPYMPKKLLHKLIQVGEVNKIPSEPKEITIMFTDIISFTNLTEQLSPEETVNLLNEHFSIITKCIEEEGGTVDKFIGDAVMAFWGAPEKQDDQAERACRAAMKASQILELKNKSGSKRISIRIGLHKGAAIVGNIGSPTRINYTITGNTVNIAQRLQESGKEFSKRKSIIIVSSDVKNSANDHFQYKELGKKEIRGLKNKMHIYELVNL